jgi:F-type H+-transporting ATPase subunit gamma
VASLKAIRKRITSVKSTQKITRAMKMVAGARLNRAQQRITELRPYAVKTQEVLSEVVGHTQQLAASAAEGDAQASRAVDTDELLHPLLANRPEKRVLLVVMTSDRGLCGAFNASINRAAEREYRARVEAGQDVRVVVIGRKGRDYLQRRNVPVEFLPGVWDKLGQATAKRVGEHVLRPFLAGDVDAIYIVYNEFKSAMTQRVSSERLLPVPPAHASDSDGLNSGEFIFEPNRTALLEHLAPLYVDVSILRALYESQASELGARMTAMDSATKNASEMIDRLTLEYNKARQAAITKELMEIIGGSEAIKD